jgi:hypothetical protein
MTALDYALVLGILGLALGGLGFFLLRQLGRLQGEIRTLEQRLRQLDAGLTAVVAGAGGQDRRVGHTEQRLHDLLRRLEGLEEQQRTSRPYDEAIRLVRQGAGAERLMEELGLSRSEAELLIKLHGS